MDILFDQITQDILLVEDSEGRLDFSFLEDESSILVQRLFLRLKTYPRDLFWNVGYGIDYLNDVFGKNKPKTSVDIVIRNEILKEPMVNLIESFESEVMNYNYRCKFTVKVNKTERLYTYYILTNEDGVILTNESGDVLTSTI